MEISPVQNTQVLQNCLQRLTRVLEQVQYLPRVSAEGGSKWLNTEGDWSFDQELKGKIVVILLCHLTSIQSVGFLKEIQTLERKLKELNEVVFLIRHMPKFESDRDPAILRQVIVNLEIEHPVVIDIQSKLFLSMDFTQSPAIILLAPDNRPVYTTQALDQIEMVEAMVLAAIQKSKESKIWMLDTQKLPIATEKAKMKEQLRQGGIQTDEEMIGLMQNLNYPTKLIFVQVIENQPKLPYPGVTKILIVSDTGNNRIIILDGDSLTFLDQIGSGANSFKDSDWDQSHFNKPQGVCHYIKNNQHCLLICDTQNHLIRSANFHSHCVQTVAGNNGVINQNQIELVMSYKELISYPIDIIRCEDEDASGYRFLVTMAGLNQVFKLDLYNSQLQKIGASDWQQPTGIAYGMFNGDQTYFVADSDSSEIRAIQASSLFTHSVCGGSSQGEQNFGDKEGLGNEAKLQFPQGLSYCQKNGTLYIADTFNHKIRTMKTKGMITNFLNDFVGGPHNDNVRMRDGLGGAARLNQPRGICVELDSGGYFSRLFIADSGNNCVRTISINGEVETQILSGIPDVSQ